MLFIHCQQEEGHHDQHHTHGGHAVSRRLTEQKEQRHAYKRPGGKADQLPSGQIEHDLGFDFWLNLWVRVHKPMWKPPSVLMRLKD